MYFSNMEYHNSRPFRTCAIQVRVMVCAWIEQLAWWSIPNLSEPFWRLYYNGARGGLIRYRNTVTELKPGRLTLIAPNTPFSSDLKNPVSHFYMHFTTASHAASEQAGIYQWKASEHDLAVIRLLIKHLTSHPPVSHIDLIAYELAVRSLMHVPEVEWPLEPIDIRVQAAMEAIRKNTGTPFSNPALAAQANMSVNGFVRLFTTNAEISPQQFSVRARIDRAGALLHNTDKSIKSIAEECGFYDRNYFTRIFIKHRLIGPAAYRKAMRGYGSVI